MLRFPSQLPDMPGPKTPARRSDSLNAAQHLKQANDMNPFFLQTEEELHDARRVQAHGQEDDLRMALSMLIDRVSQMSSMLAESCRTQADLEVQLNVAKSNLKLVISNNEMLEEALKQDRTVGWRRGGSNPDSANQRPFSADFAVSQQQQQQSLPTPNNEPSGFLRSPSPSPSVQSPPVQDSRFFTRFRFSSRPATPTSAPSMISNGLSQTAGTTSPLPSPTSLTAQIEELTAELSKERAATQKVIKEKTELEAELESLSQALFEEANKMVAQERIKHAHTTDELEQERVEKAALKDALQVIAGENQVLRASAANSPAMQSADQPERTRTVSDLSLGDSSSSQRAARGSITERLHRSLSRSSSKDAVKSIPSSRSSSLSRRGPPEDISVPRTASPSDSIIASPLGEEQSVITSPEPLKSGETTARPEPRSFPSEEDPDETITVPSSQSTDSDAGQFHTPDLPPPPWPVGHAPSTSSRVVLSI